MDEESGAKSEAMAESNNVNADNSMMHEQHQQTEAQLEEIAASIRENQQLTSDLLSLDCLKDQYKSNTHFLEGISILMEDYEYIRTIRGDGNCYYRAFLYSLCEKLVLLQQQQQNQSSNDTENIGIQIRNFVRGSTDQVINIGGYDETAIEIFHDTIVELFSSIVDKTNSTISLSDLHKQLIEENSTSDYCTWYLRVLTATYLKSDPDRFLPYLETEEDYNVQPQPLDIQTFCQTQVEPMGKECSMVQVLALVEAFQKFVQVKIVYLDGRDIPSTAAKNGKRKLMHHHFGPDNTSVSLTLLYRPGHYDILYPKEPAK